MAILLLFFIFCFGTLHALDLDLIGKKIWHNECGGTVDGLTSWNKGEAFPSLGIGHFIWYPEGVKGPFEESFPELLNFLEIRGMQIPVFLTHSKKAPWKSREQFLKELSSKDMKELRLFLEKTVPLQAEFMLKRFQESVPQLLGILPPSKKGKIGALIDRILKEPSGAYVLIDYRNFKGDGVSPKERYQGAGWGLLQVLEEMDPACQAPLVEFARAAEKVLKRRVENAPSKPQESQWLKGWLTRVQGYKS